MFGWTQVVTTQGIGMKIGWALSENIGKNVIDITTLQEGAPTWGSCSVYGNYNVDNIICNDIKHAERMVNQNIQSSANLYIPQDNFSVLGNPPNIKTFQGSFNDGNINFKDDIVTMNIVASTYDIILLLGFKFTKPKPKDDKLTQHKQLAYLHNIKTIVESNEDKQFVLVNYKGKLSKEFDDIENLSRDSLANVLELVQSL
jgi:hypothetical protein